MYLSWSIYLRVLLSIELQVLKIELFILLLHKVNLYLGSWSNSSSTSVQLRDSLVLALVVMIMHKSYDDPFMDCLTSSSKIFQKSLLLILMTGVSLLVLVSFVSSQVTIIFCLSDCVELVWLMLSSNLLSWVVALTIPLITNPTIAIIAAIINAINSLFIVGLSVTYTFCSLQKFF